MKKYFNIAAILSLLCLVVLGGCATTGSQANTSDMTIDGALQKSAEIRGKVQSAKATYDTAKAAKESDGDDSSAIDDAKTAVKAKVDEAKAQVQAEADAWKDAVK